jgi:ATP-dependent helicase/nuclease subunit A
VAAPATTEPPLRRPDVPPALVGALSYSALSDFESCGYRFYVERVLGISEPEGALTGGDGEPESRRRFGPGVAVHSLLEWSARNRWRDPGRKRAAAALREQGLEGSDEQTERALELVGAWLDSSLREQLDGARLSAEVPFVLSVGGTLVRGSIDLLAERPDGSIAVVDYKTDRLGDRDPLEAAERYRVQRDLYALAAAARGTPVETAYVFLEQPESAATDSFDQAELKAARGRIEDLLARLADGSFEVTDRPHAALCHDCPARARLCSHGREATLRDSPEPPIAPGAGADLDAGTVATDRSSEPQLSLLEGG